MSLLNKYLFFRDIENSRNENNGMSFHAAGLVERVFCENSHSGKDLSIAFIHPFSGEVYRQWRSVKEVELFQVDKGMYEELKYTISFWDYMN